MYLVFLRFPWYSRTCEIWFFVKFLSKCHNSNWLVRLPFNQWNLNALRSSFFGACFMLPHKAIGNQRFLRRTFQKIICSSGPVSIYLLSKNNCTYWLCKCIVCHSYFGTLCDVELNILKFDGAFSMILLLINSRWFRHIVQIVMVSFHVFW